MDEGNEKLEVKEKEESHLAEQLWLEFEGEEKKEKCEARNEPSKKKKVKGPRDESELMVIQWAKKLCDYIMDASLTSPKVFRYSYLNKIIDLSLEVVINLFDANEMDPTDPMRKRIVRRCIARVKSIGFIAEAAFHHNVFSDHQKEVILRYSGNCMKCLLGYYRLCKPSSAI